MSCHVIEDAQNSRPPIGLITQDGLAFPPFRRASSVPLKHCCSGLEHQSAFEGFLFHRVDYTIGAPQELRKAPTECQSFEHLASRRCRSINQITQRLAISHDDGLPLTGEIFKHVLHSLGAKAQGSLQRWARHSLLEPSHSASTPWRETILPTVFCVAAQGGPSSVVTG